MDDATTQRRNRGGHRARAIVFADPGIYIGVHLARAFIDAAAARDDVEVVAFCDAAPVPFGRFAAAKALAARAAKRAFDAAHPLVRRPAFSWLHRYLRARGIEYVVPPARNVNDDAFVGQTLPRLRVDLALVTASVQVFRWPLLAALPQAVNYHNGTLPAYRGLAATAWSVYRGESTTGFSYHRMTPGIDEGPVVVRGEIPVVPASSLAELEWTKTRLAAAAADRVLDALARGDPGVPQTGPAGYRGRAELRAITTVDDPSALEWSELQRRLRAFTRLRLTIDGIARDVTRLRRADARGGSGRLAFVTADGVAAEADRLGFLPPLLHGALRRLVPP
jgi:methionyl-tRNA formyltransferase